MLLHKEAFDAIGTKWQVESLDRLSDALLADIYHCIEQYDRTYSRFRSDSLVTKVAHQAGAYQFNEDSIELMGFYKTLYDITEGKVTPLIGSALSNAGYDSTYSLKQQKQSALPTWNEAMQWNSTLLTTSQPIILDIGAAGKGHLIDKISELLDRHHIDEYVIDASGDLLHKGGSENVVGLEHPHDPSKIIGTISIQNASMCEIGRAHV